MEKRYALTPENVDVISEQVAKHMTSLRMPQRSIIRGRLTVETILLAWMEKAPQDTFILLKLGKQFLRPYVRLAYEGQKLNPLETEKDDDTDYFSHVMTNAGLNTSYIYHNGYNCVNINLPMVGLGTAQQIVISILLAFVTCGWISSLGPEYVQMVSKEMVTPIFNSFVNLLSAVAAFMVFFNILHGVLSMGDVANLNSSGMRVLKYISIRCLLAIILSTVVCMVMYNVVEYRTDLGHNELKLFLSTLAGIVPSNLLQPFIDGNATQLIFMSIMSGVLLLTLGKQTKWIRAFVEDWNTFFMTAMGYFCAVFPIIVYLALTSVLLQGNFIHIFEIGKVLLVTAVVDVIYVGVDTLLAARKSGIGIWNYICNLWPVTYLALSTGNALACGALWDKTCAKFKFNKKFFNYSASVCQILTLPGFVIVFSTTVLGFKEVCGTFVTIPELFLAGMVYFMLAPSTASVPGGSISVMAILMAQNGLPEYCIAVYIAANLFFDMLITGVNTTCSINNLIVTAVDLDMIEK